MPERDPFGFSEQEGRRGALILVGSLQDLG